MALALSVFGFAFAAICVWLTVRIINRRERWAKRTAVGLIVGLPLLYVASFGPACWMIAADGARPAALPNLYLPISWAMSQSDAISNTLHSYALFGMRPNTRVMIPINDASYFPIMRVEEGVQ